MLHANFQDHRTSGSGAEDLKIFTIYGHGGHLGHVTWTIYINFCSPFPRRLHIQFGFDWPSGFRGEDVQTLLTTRTTTTTTTTDAGARVYYKLTLRA